MATHRPLTDLRKLRHVVEVARAESFTGAARQLGITQSALTKSVAEVEHRLGVQLLQRLVKDVIEHRLRGRRLLAINGEIGVQID